MEKVTCLKCGWVHLVVADEHASDKWQCFRCRAEGKENFRPYKESDAPVSVTIQPVNWKGD